MTQQDKKSQTIDGYTYTVHMLDPLIANDLLIDIGHTIGSSLGAIMGSVKKDGLEKLLGENVEDSEMIGKAIAGLFERLDKAKMREAIGILAGVTTVEGKGRLSEIFSEHFSGRLGGMYRWLGFAVKVQYRDFFASMSGVIAGGGLLGRDPSSSQNT